MIKFNFHISVEEEQDDKGNVTDIRLILNPNDDVKGVNLVKLANGECDRCPDLTKKGKEWILKNQDEFKRKLGILLIGPESEIMEYLFERELIKE